jgi:hypothetical protein
VVTLTAQPPQAYIVEDEIADFSASDVAWATAWL